MSLEPIVRPKKDVRVKKGRRGYNNSMVGYGAQPVSDRNNRQPLKKSPWKLSLIHI